MILCLDFGTSSIRAAYRAANGQRSVIPLGRLTKNQSLDDASLRSDLFIDGDTRTVLYGDRAVQARAHSANPLFYESSPKLWLRQLEHLNRPVLDGIRLTRGDLLIGLLACAIGAVRKFEIKGSTLDRAEIRIAHPLWEGNAINEATAKLCDLCRIAANVAHIASEAEFDIDKLHELADNPPRANALTIADVIEPIAAAVELLPSMPNTRKLCAIVDVGAGTTDIGLFQSVTPDERSSRVKSKLYPLGQARSVFKAGNAVDSALLDLIATKKRGIRTIELDDLRSQIRFIKEDIFKKHSVTELGVKIELKEFEASLAIQEIANDIRAEFQSALSEQIDKVHSWLGSHDHQNGYLTIVMAGGGAMMTFLRRQLSSPYIVKGKKVPVMVVEPSISDSKQLPLFGASIGRLAVALGGASLDYDDLVHQHPALKGIPGLGKPKQNISRPQGVQFWGQGMNQASGDRPNAAYSPVSSDPWLREITRLKGIADNGDKAAQFQVGHSLSSKGDSVELTRDAFGWYNRSAKQGHVPAQVNLGVLYAKGRGVGKNLRQAWFWWRLAANAGNQTANDYLLKVSVQLSAEELLELEAKTQVWKPIAEKL